MMATTTTTTTTRPIPGGGGGGGGGHRRRGACPPPPPTGATSGTWHTDADTAVAAAILGAVSGMASASVARTAVAGARRPAGSGTTAVGPPGAS